MRIISTSNVSDFTKVANNIVCKDNNNIFLSLDNDIHSVLCVTNGMVTYGDICLSFGTAVMDEILKYGKLANLSEVHTIYVWDVSTFDYPKDSEV